MPKSKGSMDSIQLPDKEQINSMRGGFVGSRRSIKSTASTISAEQFVQALSFQVPHL